MVSLWKKILLTVISVILCVGITGCSTSSTIMPNQLSSPSSLDNNAAINYNQYIKKVWVIDKGNNDYLMYPSFCITKIENGQITGYLNETTSTPSNYSSNDGHLTGTINKDTAICQFDNNHGFKGTLKMVFKTNNKIEMSIIEFADKSQADKFTDKVGTLYQYIPLNIKNLYGFTSVESQSFMVDLNSWGNVKFVSGKNTGDKIPYVCFYLTDKDGNVFFRFSPSKDFNVDVGAVSVQDVNKDGLKDVLIILNDMYPQAGDAEQTATIFLQNTDGTFTNDSKLDKEINESGNNKDIATVKNYLSKKF